MRKAFAETLTSLAEQDERLLLLTGDLGYTVLEVFSDRFPKRTFNTGVAEQNMMGLATGLAEAGFIPFVYSIATFASLRAYEFIRNGPIRHRFPVRVVGVGGGFEYGSAGTSHHALEDMGIMRLQPGITVVVPADHQQARSAILATWGMPGPIYYRLGKDDDTTVPGLLGRFELARTQIVREGGDLVFVTIGSRSADVVGAAEALAAEGIQCSVMIVSSLNPAPVRDLANCLAQFPLALTVEAHYVCGGLGSLVAEVVADQGLGCRIVRCGVATAPTGVTGSDHSLNHQHGISKEGLVKTTIAAMRNL